MTLIESKHQVHKKNRDFHRVIESLKSELDAIDCYNQRIDACEDTVLQALFRTIRDHHKKNTTELLEWISENDAYFNNEFQRMNTSTSFNQIVENNYPRNVKSLKRQRRQTLHHRHTPTHEQAKKLDASVSDIEGNYDLDGVSYQNGHVYIGSNSKI